MRRYLYVNHYADQYEFLIEGPKILRINKLFADSGIIRQVKFDELPNGLKDRIIQDMNKCLDYSI